MPPVAWTKNRGRNGWDSPLEVGLEASVEAVNVTLYNSGLGTKRGGSTAMTESGLSGHNALVEFVPGQDLTAAQLFIVDNSATKKILRSETGTTDAPTLLNLTLADAIVSEPYTFSAVTLNGKLYLAYDSAVNRLHVYDPDNASTDTVRRAGLAPFAAAATVANAGAGAYPATLRYYTTRSIEQQSSVVIRRSEANTSVSFTPSGGGSAARITRPTAIGEDETHWEVYGSTDNVTFYGPIATVAIATTTYDDTSTPSSWATTYDAEPVAGAQTPFPSVKFLGTTGTRLYGLGVWETTAGNSMAPKNGRFFFGPVLDASSTHDDERINNTTTLQGWLDLARDSGSPDRGVAARPVNNVIYAFQSNQHFGLVPTESDVTPYRRISYSGVGAINNQSIVIADHKDGSSAVFFLDPVKGPYTQGGRHGLKWCGKDVKDVWDTVNKNPSFLAAFGLWHPDRNLLLFWVATGTSNAPDTVLACDVTEMYVDDEGDLRGGWTVWTDDFADARCGVMFSNTCATPRSRVRVPYVGVNGNDTTLLRYDEAATSDNGTAFQASVTSGVLAQATTDVELQRAYLVASAEDGVTIQQSLVRNFGDEADRTSVALLTPEGSETTVLRKFDDAALQDAWAVQVTLGDESAVDSAWQILQWRSELKTGAPR